MSIPVAVSDLNTALADFGAGYLLSAAPGGRVKAVTVEPRVLDGLLRVSGPGRGSLANVGDNAQVTLLFPPLAQRGYTLLVDGEAVGRGRGRPRHAAERRPAPPGRPQRRPGRAGWLWRGLPPGGGRASMSGTEPFWVSAFLDLERDAFEAGTAFWSAVTGYAVSPARGAADEFATLVPPDGDDFLRVQRRAEGPSRIHLDLHVADPDAAADRAALLGATVEVRHELGYVVLTSPAGLTFCFVSHPAAVRPPPAAWPGTRSVVDQVCLDVPPSAYEVECDFWAAVLGWDLAAARLAQFRRLRGPTNVAIRFLLQRLDEEGPAGAHLDLGASDRPVEVQRHLALGATLVAEHDVWTVLRDPGGSLYCVTDRDLDAATAPGG